MLHVQCCNAAWILICDITSNSCIEVSATKQELKYFFNIITVSKQDILPNADILCSAGKFGFVSSL
jgi:hypothetical protein